MFLIILGDCPLSSKMTTCSPKCKDDTECHGLKCCPNICNTKSCAPANSVGQGSNKYKSQSGICVNAILQTVN